MAIQMRRGSFDDLDTTKLKAGEFAVCSNGYVSLKINNSQAIQMATQESIQQVVHECETYADACETYMNNAKYTYIMYSPNSDGSDMTQQPASDTRYVGIYNGSSSTRPNDPSLYNWSQFFIDVQARFELVNGHLIVITEE